MSFIAKKMENQSSHKLSTFWFGFLLGGLTAGSAAFFFGTKQGRKALKQLLEASENIEETLGIVFEEFGDDLKEKGEVIIEELSKETKNHLHKAEPRTLNSLLDKIKTLSPTTQKKVKRFFVKEGRIVEDDK